MVETLMFAPKNTNGNLDWFGGDENALLVYRYLVDLAHIWDDLIDRDKVVSPRDIHYAFAIPLILLPANPFWRAIEPEIRLMWAPVIGSYMVANAYEEGGTDHALEISHGLRYAAGQIVSYMIIRLHGMDKALPLLEDMWLHSMPERFNDYRQEHAHGIA